SRRAPAGRPRGAAAGGERRAHRGSERRRHWRGPGASRPGRLPRSSGQGDGAERGTGANRLGLFGLEERRLRADRIPGLCSVVPGSRTRDSGQKLIQDVPPEQEEAQLSLSCAEDAQGLCERPCLRKSQPDPFCDCQEGLSGQSPPVCPAALMRETSLCLEVPFAISKCRAGGVRNEAAFPVTVWQCSRATVTILLPWVSPKVPLPDGSPANQRKETEGRRAGIPSPSCDAGTTLDLGWCDPSFLPLTRAALRSGDAEVCEVPASNEAHAHPVQPGGVQRGLHFTGGLRREGPRASSRIPPERSARDRTRAGATLNGAERARYKSRLPDGAAGRRGAPGTAGCSRCPSGNNPVSPAGAARSVPAGRGTRAGGSRCRCGAGGVRAGLWVSVRGWGCLCRAVGAGAGLGVSVR
ncbi:hypothetical protein DV515_00019077, partial [Chloebia gouldiae]